ncbi:MAG: vanadium-dependent haloperoxidase [Actinomycetota bacterium]
MSSSRNHLRTRAAAALAALVAAASLQALAPRALSGPGAQGNVVLRWNEALLQGVRASTIGPPAIARALAVAHTCMFDAWAAYNADAVGTELGPSLRRPRNERTRANRREAVSFAAYRAAVDLFPASTSKVFDPLMQDLGYDPADVTTDVSQPAGIGNVACGAVLDFRHRDGANQLGDQLGGQTQPYSDYTSYSPANDPMDLTAEFDPATVHDLDLWQPLTYLNAAGQKVTPEFLVPHWNRVSPFALKSPAQLRDPVGPARAGSEEFEQQAAELLTLSANLSDRHKMISEYWSDGPNSETPPGHWNLLAGYVSRRDDHGLNADIKMYFALNNALFDASICAWDNKIAYDSVRPITAIRYLYQGQRVMAWGGPGKGTQPIDGEAWLPYQRSTFPTPPFSEYASGHSTFSAAAAEILARFTGRDDFGMSVTLPAGSSSIEPGMTPATNVTLSWPTFSHAADQAGWSRRLGGIHFKQGDLDARRAGRLVGVRVWKKVQNYIDGS